MNNKEFEERLDSILNTLFTSGFLNKIKDHTLPAQEMAQVQIQLSQIAVQTALSLNEQDFKKQELAMAEEKLRNEIEISITRERLNNTKLASEAVQNVIQTEAIKRSVVDNANINQSNSLVNFFNTSMNAISNNAASLNSGSALANISNKVLEGINKINTEPLGTNYDNLLNELVSRALNIKDVGMGNKQVAIIATKTTLAVNESVSLMGVSTFGDNEAKFVYNEQEFDTKIFSFSSENYGWHTIEFKVKNNSGEWKSAKLKIRVLKPTRQLKQIGSEAQKKLENLKITSKPRTNKSAIVEAKSQDTTQKALNANSAENSNQTNTRS